MADDDEWAPFERPDEIATAEVDKVKDNNKKSKEDKVWPAQAVKIESFAECAATLAFGEELLVLPNDKYEWRTPGGRDLAAASLLPRAEAALRLELQLADAAKRAREGQSASSSGSRAM